MTINSEELMGLIEKLRLIEKFEKYIHNQFHFRRMLTIANPNVIVDMFFCDFFEKGNYIKEQDYEIYKNELLRCYDSILGNWTNYIMNDLEVQNEVKKALEIYGLKCSQSSYTEVIDLGMQYLRDHRVSCINYQEFENLKNDYPIGISNFEDIDEDKTYIDHIMKSLLCRSLNSFDENISLKDLMIENNNNLNQDKLILVNEYQKRNLKVPFETTKPILNNKGQARIRK